MSLTAAALPPESWSRIDELLERRPGMDPFMHYTPAWGRILRDTLGDEPVYIGVEDACGALAGFLPAFFHRNEAGNHLSSLPIHNGFGGVFVARAADSEAVHRALLEAIAELASSRGCVSATLVAHPTADRPELYERYFRPTHVFDRFTQLIDIAGEYRYNQKKRNQVARAKKFALEVSILDRLEGRDLEEFYARQAASKSAMGVRPKPMALFQAVNRHGGAMPRYVVARFEGRMIAGLLLFFHGGIAEYYESWFDAAASRLQPVTLCVDAGIGEARRLGLRLWNWEASPERGDAVYAFKRKWGSRDSDFHFYTRVFGTLDRWRAMGRAALAEKYPWYFVVPYNAL